MTSIEKTNKIIPQNHSYVFSDTNLIQDFVNVISDSARMPLCTQDHASVTLVQSLHGNQESARLSGTDLDMRSQKYFTVYSDPQNETILEL